MEQQDNITMDCVSDIEQQMKKLAQELYKNPRISKVDMHVDTLMGTSVTYHTLGDPDSPLCKALRSKEIQNAIQDIERPPLVPTESAPACPRNLPGSLQQWMGTE